MIANKDQDQSMQFIDEIKLKKKKEGQSFWRQVRPRGVGGRGDADFRGVGGRFSARAQLKMSPQQKLLEEY